MCSVLGVKWVTKIKDEPLIFIVQFVCEVSHGMVKWSTTNAVRHSHGLEGTKILLILLLLLFVSIRGISYKSTQTVKYPDLSSALRPGPHAEELPAPKLPE